MNPPASLFLHRVRPTDPADRTITIHYWCQSASLISGDKIPRQLFSHHFQLAIGRHLNYICNGVLCSSGILKTQLVKVTWVHPTSSLRPLGETNDAPVVVNVATGGYRLFFFFFSWSSEMGLWTERCGCVRHMDSSVGGLCSRCPHTQVQIAVALHRDTESRAHFDTARGDREQRNVLSSTFRLSLLLTAPYSFHTLH